ncbi:ribonuclease H-like domain-containing protein [Tanacetum coccineum]
MGEADVILVSTPMDTSEKLIPNNGQAVSQLEYSRVIGCLMYVITCTRPDIAFDVGKLSRYTSNPSTQDWQAIQRFTLSRSSAEAEYRGVANAVAETCWLRNLLRELHTPLFTATIVYYDNVNAVYLSSNPVQHQRTKHIEIDIHFVRDLVTTGHIRVLHVPSRYRYADIFTKCLPTALFDEFRDSLSVRSSPAQTAGGC